jgi:flagellar hook-basal body complex protein FliE
MVEGIYQSKVNSLLSQIRAHQEKADLVAQDAPSSSAVATEGKEGFGTYVENAVRSVNESQMASADMRDAYERGEDIPLTDVVLAMQKSSLAFEATLQVRNKLLKAYEDVMNMPV